MLPFKTYSNHHPRLALGPTVNRPDFHGGRLVFAKSQPEGLIGERRQVTAFFVANRAASFRARGCATSSKRLC